MIIIVNVKTLNSVFLILGLITLLGITSFQIASAENKEDNTSSPKKQLMLGVDIHKIQCKEGYDLILKTMDWSPACCKSSSVDKLIQRGWAADHDTMHDKMMDSMINLPEDMINTDEAMMKAKETMKEASENPTSISEDISEMMGDNDTNEIQVLKTGEFKGADFFHNAKGQSKIVKTGDQTFLRFENFEVTNGPDLRVYLTSDGDIKNGIQLEKLKGSTGDQNYLLDNVDIGIYDTVIIYCQPFGVYFGQAEMS